MAYIYKCPMCGYTFEVTDNDIRCPNCGYKVPYKSPTGKIPVTTNSD